MRRTVEAVRADGWPAVFAFVFDDFWSIARSPRLLALLEASLGAGCLQNSVIWTHWVPGAKGATGWPPHVDLSGVGDKFLSLWISLSEAAIDNSCMFLIPPGDAPREVVEAIHAKADLPYASYSNLLHNVVALPVPAGSLIGWRGDVLHWGGTNAGGDVPRVSFALEFRSRDEAFTKFERPMIDLRAALPPLRLRLYAIAKALRHYPKFEPIVSRFQPLADRLWNETMPVS
jgi:ectoine hydroxylase-related dioxygenase (phytanoyl-CoA dioxygenase family)